MATYTATDLDGASIAIRRRQHAEAATVPSPLAAYQHDPQAFVHDCFAWRPGEGPTAYQDDILAALPTERRVAVRGPHGLGKTALASWVVLWFTLTRDGAGTDWKLPTTASAWRQLSKFLWPEVHKWARRLRWERIGREPFSTRAELLALSLKLGHGEAFAVASDTAELIEGAHADSLLYLFDEAKTIPGDTFDAAEGAFAGAGVETGVEAFALAVSTPGEPQGRFYDIHRRAPGFEDWWTRHVTLDEALAAKRVSQEWQAARLRQWGAQSAVYQNRVLGEFAASDEDGVIPLAWVEAANERWREWHEQQGDDPPPRLDAIGVDVARSGEDKTVLAPRAARIVTELRRYSREDTMTTAGRVRGLQRAHGGTAIVDVIGIGAGVVDRLREDKVPVLAFNASEGTAALDRSGELGYSNVRSAAWWGLREQLDPAYGADLALPPDDQLTGDLTAPHWRVLSGGKIQVESKDDIRKRLGRSTDDGDAVMQACYAAPRKPQWGAS